MTRKDIDKAVNLLEHELKELLEEANNPILNANEERIRALRVAIEALKIVIVMKGIL